MEKKWALALRPSRWSHQALLILFRGLSTPSKYMFGWMSQNSNMVPALRGLVSQASPCLADLTGPVNGRSLFHSAILSPPGTIGWQVTGTV